jgi:hypothetical protein
MYLILIDGNDDDGSQRDDDGSKTTIITAAAATTTAIPSSVIAMNEDVPSLVSCFVIVNHTLNSYCTLLESVVLSYID